MKALSLAVGFIMMAAAVAGFFGVIALSTVQCAMLFIVGVIAFAFGLKRGATLPPPNRGDGDMRNLSY